MLRKFLVLALAGAAFSAGAQLIPDIHIDWKENEAPPPPPLRTRNLVPIDVAGTSLRFGVDPESISIGSDGVVRYVVVATSNSGAVNGIYEGLKCNSGEVKVYARHNPDSGWVPAGNSEWRDVYSIPNTRYSLAIARSGACRQRAANVSPAQILQDLRLPADMRFETQGMIR